MVSAYTRRYGLDRAQSHSVFFAVCSNLPIPQQVYGTCAIPYGNNGLVTVSLISRFNTMKGFPLIRCQYNLHGHITLSLSLLGS